MLPAMCFGFEVSSVSQDPADGLLNADAVVANSEHRVAARERLCARASAEQVLAVRVSLARDEEVEEILHVAAEVVDGAAGDERVDRHLPVGALVQLPAVAGDVGGGDGGRAAIRAVAA